MLKLYVGDHENGAMGWMGVMNWRLKYGVGMLLEPQDSRWLT